MVPIEIFVNEENKYQGNLKKYFDILIHATNVMNPYHGIHHMLHVVQTTYQIAYETNIDPLDMRILLIAAIFHDFGHTGKMGNDAEQVNASVNYMKQNLLQTDIYYVELIERLIRCTQFPYSTEPIDILEKILRDADMSPALHEVWIEQVMFGIAAELGIKPVVALKNQLVFVDKMQFYTDWAIRHLNPKKADRIKEIQSMLSIIS